MNHQNHNGKKHGLLMLLCCLIPILAVAFLPRLGVELGPIGRLAPYALLLLCPIMHIGMMVFMFKGNKNQDCHKSGNIGDENN